MGEATVISSVSYNITVLSTSTEVYQTLLVLYDYHIVFMCSWPAVITPDPFTDNTYIEEGDDGCIYHVEFLGRHRSHSWLPEEMVNTTCHEVFGYIILSQLCA